VEVEGEAWVIFPKYSEGRPPVPYWKNANESGPNPTILEHEKFGNERRRVKKKRVSNLMQTNTKTDSLGQPIYNRVGFRSQSSDPRIPKEVQEQEKGRQ